MRHAGAGVELLAPLALLTDGTDNGHDEVAARGKLGEVAGEQVASLGGGEEVQDAADDQAHRGFSVNTGEDGVHVTEVAFQHRYGGDRHEVVHHHRVVVHVGDAGPRVGRAGDLVRGRRGRQPAADIDELVDVLFGYPGNRAGKESLVLPHDVTDVRDEAAQPVSQLTVGCEVVPSAEQEVIDPGGVGHGRVESWHVVDPNGARRVRSGYRRARRGIVMVGSPDRLPARANVTRSST
jgi:hypothetical protein